MTTKAIIIDDEVTPRETLKMMLKIYAPEVEVIAEAEGVKTGIQAIKKHNPDLVFLDIHMGDGSGFDLLSNFASYNFKVVFVTAYEEYAIKAFRFSALDYLVKPIIPEDLVQAVNKISVLLENKQINKQLDVLKNNYLDVDQSFGKIILKTAEAIYIVELNDIIYCKSDNNYTNFYLVGDNKLLVSRTLKEFDDLLSESGFLRVHQSYLVNSKQIEYFDKREGGSVVMKDGCKIPVSFRKKEQLLLHFKKLGRFL